MTEHVVSLRVQGGVLLASFMEALQSNLSKLLRRDIVSFELYCITEILHADSSLNSSHYLFMCLAKMELPNLTVNLQKKIDTSLAFSGAHPWLVLSPPHFLPFSQFFSHSSFVLSSFEPARISLALRWDAARPTGTVGFLGEFVASRPPGIRGCF